MQRAFSCVNMYGYKQSNIIPTGVIYQIPFYSKMFVFPVMGLAGKDKDRKSISTARNKSLKVALEKRKLVKAYVSCFQQTVF